MNNIKFIEKRKEERLIPKDNSMFVKLALTYPKDGELIKPIFDISPSGLSFKMDEKEGYLLPGSPLKNIVVKSPECERAIPNSVVRNCTHIETNNEITNRIGIEFLIKPFEKSIIRRKLLSSYKLRMPRYSGNLAPLLNWKISFIYKGQIVKSNTVLNFSKFGIAFRVKPPILSFKNSEVLYDLKIKIDDEFIYEGEGLIADLQNNDDYVVLRCSLRKGHIDLEKVSILSRVTQTAEGLNNFAFGLKKIEDIDSEFKANVADLRYFLEKLKTRLDIEDREVDNLYYKEKLIDNISNHIFKRLDKFFNYLIFTVSNFHETKYDLYKNYFREHVHKFFLESPFVDQSYHKPLGYAGDYAIMNLLYANPYAGTNLFAKLINRHAWIQTAAIAVRNRIPYLINKFSDLLNSQEKRNDNYLRIMNVGCGPAAEVQEMIQQNPHVEKFIFTLIDADSEALLYCQDKLLNLIRETGCNVNISFVNKAVDQLIKDKDLTERLGKQDLIYSVGLFDYLSIGLNKRITKRLYELLNENGRLIIGNFNHLNDTKTYMEFILEWYLFHRSEDEMLKFVEKLSKPKRVYFETDGTKTTNFLIIEK